MIYHILGKDILRDTQKSPILTNKKVGQLEAVRCKIHNKKKKILFSILSAHF